VLACASAQEKHVVRVQEQNLLSAVIGWLCTLRERGGVQGEKQWGEDTSLHHSTFVVDCTTWKLYSCLPKVTSEGEEDVWWGAGVLEFPK
jgi:hypothetical protein